MKTGDTDPPGMTKRQAARAALKAFRVVERRKARAGRN